MVKVWDVAKKLKKVTGEVVEVMGNVIYSVSSQMFKNITGLDPEKTLEDAMSKKSKSSSILTIVFHISRPCVSPNATIFILSKLNSCKYTK